MAKSEMTEIRWHGRGGQGAKSACLMLAEVAGRQGKFVQGFPEYGPERMCAPITAYNRICSERCPVHSNIYDPDYVVVLDETLLDSVPVTAGLKPTGAIIVNTSETPDELRKRFPDYTGRVCTLDARKISEEVLGKNFPNTALLAAAVKVSGVLPTDEFLAHIEDSFKHKFATKPQVIAGNMEILKRAFEEVQG